MYTKKICLWTSFVRGFGIGLLALVFHIMTTDDEPDRALIRSWHYFDPLLCGVLCVARKFFWNIRYFDPLCLAGIFTDSISVIYAGVCIVSLVAVLMAGTHALPIIGIIALIGTALTIFILSVIGLFVLMLYGVAAYHARKNKQQSTLPQ